MTYQQLIYNAIWQNRSKEDGVYYELHHIIPKCMGGNDKKTNLVYLTVPEHVLAHYLLAIEAKDKRTYYSNLNSAWFVANGKSKFNGNKEKVLQEWLSNPEAQAFTLRLKEGLKGQSYPNRKKPTIIRAWVCKALQEPIRILKHNVKDGYYKDWQVIENCPICHKENSQENFACCEEHRQLHLNNLKAQYLEEQSKRISNSWKDPSIRNARIAKLKGHKVFNFYWITNGVESKQHPKEEPIPEGWIRGRVANNCGRKKTEEEKKFLSERKSKTCLVHNDECTKEILKTELELYLSQGWQKGMKPHTMPSKKGLVQPKMCFVHLGEITKKIQAKYLNEYLEKGWKPKRK